MRLSTAFEASASALTAQRMRMDVISSNVAHAQTTRAKFENGQFQPYRRKMVEMQTLQPSFKSVLAGKLGNSMSGQASGVKVTKIIEDQTPFKLVYDPTHPDANRDGYVEMPNVDIAKEMIDMLSAVRLYESNITALNATKSMFVKALEINR